MSKTLTSTVIKKSYKQSDEVSSISQRAAHFFHWAAKSYPKQFISWGIAYRASTGFWRTSERAKEVELFRQRGSSIRRILIDDYNCEFTTKKGLGARATVDSEDTLKTEAVKKARRLQSAATAATRTAALINTSEIRDPEWKKWLTRSLRGVIKEISSAEFNRKLLPPGYEDVKNGKSDKS